MTLIDEYLDWLRLRRCSAHTIRDRGEILRRIDRDLSYGLESATEEELKLWLYRDGWSAATLSTYYGAARAFFVWACSPDDQRLDLNPMRRLPYPKSPRGLPRPVSDDQLRHILTNSIEPYRTWSLLAAYEGLRCMEIAGLHREHVTQDSLRVVYGKRGRPGVVPTHPAVWDALKDRPLGPIAITERGMLANPEYVSIRSALYFRRRLDMPGVALHRLRHWFGTNLMRKTGNLRVVQELLRHASPNTTAIYTLVTSEERLAATQALPNFTDPQSC